MLSLVKNERICLLFDAYGSLLTEHQKQIISEYYFNDLSLAEVSINFNCTRQSVLDIVKRTIDKLEYYEANLHLLSKNNFVVEALKLAKSNNLQGCKNQIEKYFEVE